MTIKYYNPWAVGLSIILLFAITACGGGNKTTLQPDTTAPVITLLGDPNITIIKDTEYTDAGATATDNIDGTVTVTASGAVDPQTLGEYTITYSATDRIGNTATITRVIKVTLDTTAPVITINGENPTEIYQGGIYSEAGASAMDEVNGEVEISISGKVDTSITGSYTIIYSAIDLAGNIVNSIRIVNVVADPNRQVVASIDFSDASLQKCVDDNDNNYLYADEFSSLECSFYGIDNLNGLSHFKNLTHLNIFGNQLSDLTFVGNLTQLTFLNAGLNQLTDISFLSGLINLQTLYLPNNSITHIAALENLTQMVRLDLIENNAIEDISSIANMTELEHLQLNRNRIRDLAPLAGLKQLNNLTLYSNNISDVSDLAGLTNLVVLNLAVNNITDVSPLAGLNKIAELKLLNNDIDTGVDLLNAFDDLQQMYLNGNDNIPCIHLDILREAYSDEVISMSENCAAATKD